MQFSCDLPSGRNVSTEADAAFIAELERSDPSRHARLMKAQGTRKFESDRWAVGKCSACGGQILDAPFVRADVESDSEASPHLKFCSRTCRDGSDPAKRDRSKPRKYRNCLGCRRKFLSRRANNTTCSNRCRQKTHRGKAVTDSCQAPSEPRIDTGD